MQAVSSESSSQASAGSRTFPDPTITLVEFSGEGLGVLLAARTERDAANRRLLLKKVAYVRLEQKDWGASAFPEIWIQQTPDGLFQALEPQSGRILRFPSRRRYEVAFLSKDLFDCGIQCLKERKADPLYELIVVTFAQRPGFSVEAGFLLAPDDYAAETDLPEGQQWVPLPPRIDHSAAKG